VAATDIADAPRRPRRRVPRRERASRSSSAFSRPTSVRRGSWRFAAASPRPFSSPSIVMGRGRTCA
jgi:hypothetical protein